MRNKPLKGLINRSPIKKTYDFTKKREFGEGKIGKAIAHAVTPKNWADMIPTTRAFKAGKALYSYFTS